MFRLLRWLITLALIVGVVVGVLLFSLDQQRERREVHSAQELAPATGQYVQAGDVRLYMQEAGPATGPAVVFIPGAGEWSALWQQPMTLLGARGYHAIAIDLPPFGFSQRPDPTTYDKRHQALRIVGLLDTLGIDRAVLVGHSFGAAPAVEAALVAPRRVTALVLVDAVLGIRSKAGQSTTRLPTAVEQWLIDWPRVRELLVGCFLTNPDLTRPLLQLVVADRDRVARSWVTQAQAPLGIRDTSAAVNDWLDALLVDDSPGFSEFSIAYPWLKMPLVLIWGRQDRVAPVEEAEQVRRLAPRSQLVVLDGVGHVPPVEDVDGFSQRLEEAVASLQPLPGR